MSSRSKKKRKNAESDVQVRLGELSVTLRGVIYARYSEGGRQTDQSLEGQVRECQKYAQDNNIIIVATYLDPHISGKDAENRPEFQRMIKDSSKNLFDVVIVWKTDRFARNRYDSARYKERLRRNGVSIRYAAENIPDSAEGIILESMLEGMAEYYSADLRQKIMRGMRESAYKCKVLSTPPIGYMVDSERHYAIDPETGPLIRRIFEMFNQGARQVDIAEYMNQLGLRTVKGNPLRGSSISKIVTNEKYIGVYEYKCAGIRVEDAFPPIVTKDVFQIAQKRIEMQKNGSYSNRNRGRPAKRSYLLSGLIFCGECGDPMNGETTRKKYNSGKITDYGYYVCRSHRRGRQSGSNSSCPHVSIHVEAVEEVVKEVIKDVIVNPSLRDAIHKYVVDLSVREESQSQIKVLQGKKKVAEASISNLISALEQGIYSNNVTERLRELEREVYTLSREINKQKQMSGEVTKKIDWMIECVHTDNVLTETDWRRLVQVFVKSVTCYSDGVIEICLNFYNNPTPDSQLFRVKVQKSINAYLMEKRKHTFRQEDRGLHSKGARRTV